MESILNFLSALIDYLIMPINSLISIISMTADMGAAFALSLSFVPSFIEPFLQFSLTLTLVFAVLRLLP